MWTCNDPSHPDRPHTAQLDARLGRQDSHRALPTCATLLGAEVDEIKSEVSAAWARRPTHHTPCRSPSWLSTSPGVTIETSKRLFPVFLTSTFQFKTAEEGKRFFELAYGLRKPDKGEEEGLIYSRLNNPNLQIMEERMAAWDRTDIAATFASGMAAISTTFLALLRSGDVLLTTEPVYGVYIPSYVPGRGHAARLR